MSAVTTTALRVRRLRTPALAPAPRPRSLATLRWAVQISSGRPGTGGIVHTMSDVASSSGAACAYRR